MPDKLRIDTQLFIDIITSEDGVVKVFEDEVDGEIIGYFKGKKGVISINLTKEFITNRTAKAHMRQLGIDELIIKLFPTDEAGI